MRISPCQLEEVGWGVLPHGCGSVLPVQGDMAHFLVLLLSPSAGGGCLWARGLEGGGVVRLGWGGVEMGSSLKTGIAGVMNRVNFK